MELRVSLKPAVAQAFLRHCRSAHLSEQDAVERALISYLRQDNSHKWPDSVFDFEPFDFRFEELRADGSLLPQKEFSFEGTETENA